MKTYICILMNILKKYRVCYQLLINFNSNDYQLNVFLHIT